MRLNTLCLIGSLTVTAMPLTAGATSPQLYRQQIVGVQQDTPAATACAPGWYWEPALCHTRQISPGALRSALLILSW